MRGGAVAGGVERDNGRMRRFAFAGRTCVVTGAAGGIGAALSLELARRRAVLVLIDRDAVRLSRVAGLAREGGAAAVDEHVIDLADGGDRLDLAQRVATAHGGADLLVNNAGVALAGDFAQNEMADVEWLLEINLMAVLRMTKAFLPQLLARPGAHIVNLSSLFGLVAPAGQVAYSTSKFAVRGFSEALRHELAGRDVGVTVVHPGGVRTDIARSARISGPDPEGTVRRQTDLFSDRALRLPPEEAARLIVRAVQERRPRLVITREAKLGDLLARVAPARYWQIVRRARNAAEEP